jgi:hypothetical protein
MPVSLPPDERAATHRTTGQPPESCFRAVQLPVAFIDWDSCRPGDRLDDLGYLAWTWCIQSQGQVPVQEQARHLREMRDGYGDVEPEPLIRAILRRQTEVAETEEANLRDPRHTAERRRHAEWAVAWATADRQLVAQHEGNYSQPSSNNGLAPQWRYLLV